MKLSSYSSPPPQAVSGLKAPATLSSKSAQRTGANYSDEVPKVIASSVLHPLFYSAACIATPKVWEIENGIYRSNGQHKLFADAFKSTQAGINTPLVEQMRTAAKKLAGIIDSRSMDVSVVRIPDSRIPTLQFTRRRTQSAKTMEDLYEQGWRVSQNGLMVTAPEIEAKYPSPSSFPAGQYPERVMEEFLKPWQDVLRPVPISTQPPLLEKAVLDEMSTAVSAVYNAIQSHGSLPGHGPNSTYTSNEKILVY